MRKLLCCFISCCGLLLLTGALAQPPKVEYAAEIEAIVRKAEPRAALPPIARTAPVTKADYLKTGEFFFAGKQKNADYWLKQPKLYPEAGMYMDFALWYGKMYQLTGVEDHAIRAAQSLQAAWRIINDPALGPASKGMGFRFTTNAWALEQWLRKSPAYTDAVKADMRSLLLYAYPKYDGKSLEYGSFNRSYMVAAGAENLFKLKTDAPDAALWRAYIEQIWRDFWVHRDTDEDSDEYNALSICLLLDWVDARGNAKEFWADPGVKTLMERYLYKVTPMGAFPHHPDTMGWNETWGHWIYVFEACAAHWKDGRYKWAAHRLHDYAVNRIENLNSFPYTGEFCGWSLLKAYSVADDTIAEVPRDRDTVLLMRHQVVQRSTTEIQRTNQWFDILPEMMPDKLVFHGGTAPESMSLMVDASPNIGHSHDKRPYIVSLVDKGSVLLMALGYIERAAEEHNMPLLRDYEGYLYDNTPWNVLNDNNAVKGAMATDLGPVGYGQVKLGKYFGYPADLTRDIVFIKNVGVVVKDTLTMQTDLRVRWGALYRVRNLAPDFGANWANTYLGDWVPLRGLGNNSTILTRWRNEPRDLLLYFLPDKDGTLEVLDESGFDKTRPLPLRVHYTLRQQAAANAPRACTSLLLPHAPGPGKPLADKVRTILNEPTRTVLEFTDESGAQHLVALNTSGKPLKVGGLSTDATVAYLKSQGGKLLSVALHGGKSFIVNGKEIAKQAKPAQQWVVGVE
jgi:hypothetical protein